LVPNRFLPPSFHRLGRPVINEWVAVLYSPDIPGNRVAQGWLLGDCELAPLFHSLLRSRSRRCLPIDWSSGSSKATVDKPSTLVSFFQQIFCMPFPSIGVEQDRFSETDIGCNPKRERKCPDASFLEIRLGRLRREPKPQNAIS
jgi:hypothetical protein